MAYRIFFLALLGKHSAEGNLDASAGDLERTCQTGACEAVRLRSLLQQNASAVLQSATGGQKMDETFDLSLLVVEKLTSEDWASVVLPVLAVFVLIVSAGIYFTPSKAPALPRSSVSLTPAPSLTPSSRQVPVMPRPSQVPASAPRGSVQRPLSLTLCPDLIVPDGVECTLNVPRLALLHVSSQVNVSDAKGGPVFRVKYSYTPDRDGTRLVLMNPSSEVVFATASDSRTVKQEGRSPAQRPALSIINPKDPSRPYLLEDKGRGDYQVSNTAGQFVRFLQVPGGFNAIDGQDQLLAFLDPPVNEGAGQVARVGPLVDAGLMVMCFLGIGAMVSDQKKSGK